MEQVKDITVFSKNDIFSALLIMNCGAARFERLSLQCESSLVSSTSKYCLFPGFTDVHVHFREPGFSYKETISSGSAASVAGGYTRVCTMPNISPVADSFANLKIQLDLIQRDSHIEIFPYGSITHDEKGLCLSEMEEMAPYICGFSDDGNGVANESIMLEAMKKARALNKIIAAHCEDISLSNGGVIHEGAFSKQYGFPTISSESEYTQVKRDILLAEKTGCSYHVCHVSAKESVELIRKAKKHGVDITCETAPHYLLIDNSELINDGKYKMKPPLRTDEDREALIQGICDGTIDMIATDHAPHSSKEKLGGLMKSAFGITGLETAFPALYTFLVLKEKITLSKLIELMSFNPDSRFFPDKPKNISDNFTIFDLNERYCIDPNEFNSKGKSTPFEGLNVYGKCKLTVRNGRIIYKDDTL